LHRPTPLLVAAAIVLITGIAVVVQGTGRFGTSAPFPHPAAAPAPTTVVPTSAVLTVPPASRDNGIAIGAWQVGLPWDFTALDRLERDAQHHMAIVALWRCWGGSNSTLDPTWLSTINARGSVPMITWSPQNWDPRTDQAPYSLDNIAKGTNDAYIRAFASVIKKYGGPVLLRPMHEMNGDWYPWSNAGAYTVKNGGPARYIAAWRHIHDLFAAVGAWNAKWVWSPNVYSAGSRVDNANRWYPGDAYVDWVGLDGYNKAQDGWKTFSQIFDYSVHNLAGASKPMLLAEMSSSEALATQIGVSKAAWYTDAFTSAILSLHRIKAVVIFNEDKTTSEGCCNWTIESSAASQSAFAHAIAGYSGTFIP